MARLSRDKGQRIERELVHLLLDTGIPASRVPLEANMRVIFTCAAS